jgi:hypothetical protein
MYHGEHERGSPIPIVSTRKPYARIEMLDRGTVTSVNQQYLFKIVARCGGELFLFSFPLF